MRRSLRRSALVVLAVASFLWVGCGTLAKTAPICQPGATQVCIGPGACHGGQACTADGTAWGTCDCGGGGGAVGTGGATGAGGADAGATAVVTATVSGPTLALSPSGGLGQGIMGGGFTLELHLGHANKPSEVTVGAFTVEQTSGGSVVLPALAVQTTTTFPLAVQPNSDVMVTFTVPPATATLASSAVSQLCSTDGVVIAGTLDDATTGKQSPVYSPTFYPTGCP